MEAPALFRVGAKYVLTLGLCCYCRQGSGLFAYTATDPLGPWAVAAADWWYQLGV